MYVPTGGSGSFVPKNKGLCKYTVERLGWKWFEEAGTLIVKENVAVGDGNIKDVTYDGSSHKLAPTVKGADSRDLAQGSEYELKYYRGDIETTDFTSAGQIKVVVNFIGNFGDDSYYPSVTKTYNINPAEATVSVKGKSETKTYSGEKQSVKGFEVTDVKSDASNYFKKDSVVLKESGSDEASGTDASAEPYKMGLTGDSFTCTDKNFNVKYEVTDGGLTINPAEVTVSVEGNTKTATYSGEKQSVEGFKVIGVKGDDAVEYFEYDSVVLKESGSDKAQGTDADTYKMGLTEGSFYCANENFKVVEYLVTDGELTIDPAGVTVTADAKSKVYGDDDPEFTAQVDGLVNGESEDLIKYVIFRSNEDEGAGTYKGVIELEGEESQGNYAVSFVPADFTIAKRAIEVSDSATYAYNGQEQALSIDAAKVTNLVDGDRLYLNGAQVKGTEPGTYTDVTEYTWDVVNDKANVTANYNLKVSGELTITKADSGSGSAADNGNTGKGDKTDKAKASSASPQTGDSIASFAMAAGIIAIVAALAAFFVSRKLRGTTRR